MLQRNGTPAEQNHRKETKADKAFRMNLKKANLDKLLRVKRADIRYLFPELKQPEREKLESVKDGGQVTIWDEQGHTGLCVLVSPGLPHKEDATVTLRACYYLKGYPGIPKYHKLGRYPDELADPAEARKKSGDIRSRARDGHDPKRPHAGGDVRSVFETYLVAHAKKNKTSDETKRA